MNKKTYLLRLRRPPRIQEEVGNEDAYWKAYFTVPMYAFLSTYEGIVVGLGQLRAAEAQQRLFPASTSSF